MNNWQSQCNFISVSVKINKCNKTRVGESSRKQNTRIFTISNRRVCKKVFLNTLQISNRKLDYCLRKKVINNTCSPDKRGRVTPNRTSDDKLKQIEEFFDSIPKYRSHYSLNDKIYFGEHLTLPLLYKTYSERERENGRQPVSKPIFTRQFKSYNVAIYVPRTDTCQFCDSYKMKKNFVSEAEKKQLEAENTEHLVRAKKAREYLQTSIKEAKRDPGTLLFTFDMQKNAPLPRLNTSVVFYKRQLWVYNVGINTCVDRQGYMAVWTETEGKRGANEVCSCIWEFLSSVDISNVQQIKTFSDSCGGQNRNKTVITFFMWVCDTLGIDSWEHTYLESGHSYLPNDQDFSTIEKKSKKQIIYTKEQWFNFIREAREKLPFKVIEMKNKMLKFETLVKNRRFNNSKTSNGEKFNFLKLKSFRVTKNSNLIYYTTMTDRQRYLNNLEYPLIDVTQLKEVPSCSSSVEISSEKFRDIMSLLRFIPAENHEFYESLPHH